MRIEIVSAEYRDFSGMSGRTGKAYSMRKQEGFAHIEGQKYPVRIEFNIPQNSTGWTPGMYELLEDSFFIDRYGSLALSGELKLKPVPGSLSKVG